ncbi:MAG TPA: hypothetical protein VHT68_21415 [Pseudolabrys sp.]|nr:hypothetical protein [Pseudolabrys sp.]
MTSATRSAGKAAAVSDEKKTSKQSQNRSPLFMPHLVTMQWSNGV